MCSLARPRERFVSEQFIVVNNIVEPFLFGVGIGEIPNEIRQTKESQYMWWENINKNRGRNTGGRRW